MTGVDRCPECGYFADVGDALRHRDECSQSGRTNERRGER